MNVLILTGKFGMGHAAAAGALAETIQKSGVADRVEVVDFCEVAFAGMCSFLYQAYASFIVHGSPVYNMVYRRATALKPSLESSSKPWDPYFLHCLGKLFEQYQPDVVVSTYSFCSYLTAAYKRKNHSELPLVTCITDVSCHSVWLNEETDLYLVADERTQGTLKELGFSDEQVIVAGIPVDDRFTNRGRKQQQPQKELLVMGGGLGLLPEQLDFYEQLDGLPDLHTTVVCGKNKHLRQKLEGRFANIEVRGFAADVDELMKRADLLLTKPGGVTVFEALAAETPLLIFRPQMEQEIHNCDYLQANGMGQVLTGKAENCVAEIAALLANEPQLAAIRKNMRRTKSQWQPDAVVDFIAALQPQPQNTVFLPARQPQTGWGVA